MSLAARKKIRSYGAALRRLLKRPGRSASGQVDQWIYSHVVEAPGRAAAFYGDLLNDANVLNVGCGEMLMDFGLLNYGPAAITGLDIDDNPNGWLENVARKITEQTIEFPRDYAKRLSYKCYDGTQFPFENNAFDFIFSWSAFEHILDMDAVLSEMHRVLRPSGYAFVQVSPWYGSRHGSHLIEYIDQPFFHHTQDNDWVEKRLNEAAENYPADQRPFITQYMYSAYATLNRKSCDDFYESARKAGFVICKARVVSHDEDLTHAPRNAAFHDLMVNETMMLMRKE